MPSIQVKDVPAEVHATMRRRAAMAGQSLQEYLLDRLVADAATPTLSELFGTVEHHTGGEVPLAAAVEAVRADRRDR